MLQCGETDRQLPKCWSPDRNMAGDAETSGHRSSQLPTQETDFKHLHPSHTNLAVDSRCSYSSPPTGYSLLFSCGLFATGNEQLLSLQAFHRPCQCITVVAEIFWLCCCPQKKMWLQINWEQAWSLSYFWLSKPPWSRQPATNSCHLLCSVTSPLVAVSCAGLAI